MWNCGRIPAPMKTGPVGNTVMPLIYALAPITQYRRQAHQSVLRYSCRKCFRKRLTQMSRCKSRNTLNCGWTTSARHFGLSLSTVWGRSSVIASLSARRRPLGQKSTETSCGTASSMMNIQPFRKQNCDTRSGEPQWWKRDSSIPPWIFEGCGYDQFKIRTPSVISDSQNSVADKNSPPKDTFSSEALV